MNAAARALIASSFKAAAMIDPTLTADRQAAALDSLEGKLGKPGRGDIDCRLVTYTEAARRLNLSRVTVYRLVKFGRLDVVPLDGVNRIRLKSVIDFANGATR